jgi:D-arabinose 5-phosphate isomerase GutQ
MSTYSTSYADRLPVIVSIHVPGVAATEQPFLYSTQTYVPGMMSLCEAEAMLKQTVRDGAIAHLMETMGLDEAQAVATICPDAVKVEFASL